jgi:type IV pilus assembly protein PilM
MPKMSQSQLMMNLPYEFNDFIHGEPEQYYCDYAVCEPTPAEEEKGEMALMAAVAHKERITGYLKMFSRAGISLKILLPQEMALVQLVQSYQERNPQAAVKFCFVDIGYNTTQITIVSGDRLEAVRQVHIGGRDLDEVVADELNIDPFLADSYMRKNHMDILNHPRCVDVYNQLAIEILKVINFYHFTAQGSDLESIYLIGGCANIPALRHTIGDTLGMEIHTAHELLPISEGKQEDYKTGILAAGVALAREV